MSIALLYERSENDENGIKLTAQQLGIDLTFLPFRKIALSISKDGFSAKTKGKDYTSIIKDIAVVLNRAQSKNRRLQASYIMEMLGKKTLNSSQIEFVCYSKLQLQGRPQRFENLTASPAIASHRQGRKRTAPIERLKGNLHRHDALLSTDDQ